MNSWLCPRYRRVGVNKFEKWLVQTPFLWLVTAGVVIGGVLGVVMYR